MPTVYKGIFRDVRVIAPTWPGFGGSTPNPDETLLGFAREIKLVLESLNVAKFMLIGSSWYALHLLRLTMVIDMAGAVPSRWRWRRSCPSVF